MQTLFGGRDGRFDLFGAPALLARRPVQAAQAVQNRAANLVLGVGLQFDVVARIEAVDGGDQADGAGGDQVVQVHALRASVRESAGRSGALAADARESDVPALRRRLIAHLVLLDGANKGCRDCALCSPCGILTAATTPNLCDQRPLANARLFTPSSASTVISLATSERRGELV